MSFSNRRDAITAILSLFATAWTGAGQSASRVKYDNVGKSSLPPDGNLPWARVVLRHTSSDQASLSGEVGTRRFQRNGLLTIQIFVPPGKGLAESVDIPKIIQDAYEGVRTTDGVWFKNVTLNEIGPDGDFYQHNVVAAFEYDEIK
jgi:hypothetical protein